MTIKLLLVDDQSWVREGLKMRLALESDFRVVGEAGNGVEALQAVQTLAPDVVVMDVEMPQMDGISATKLLRVVTPQTGVVMLSIHGDADTRARALEAGVDAFVEKQEPDEILLDAIHQVARISTD
jgi:DNA-binding NarL/FixJ family response regulator